MKVVSILTEYLNNPIGIDIKNPRITWHLEDVKKQTAYQVKYSINGKEYDSGKIESSSMNYTFKDKLASRDIVTFQVKVFDENNNESEYSEACSFEMGLLNKEDFKAKWITGNYKAKKNLRYPVDYFQKSFDSKDVVKARLYITATGIYEANINSKRVGEFILAPGTTDYNKRIQYQSYDVTDLIQEGSNELSILLADGWYRGSIGAKGFTCVFGTTTRVFAQLELTNSKGEVTTIGSDSSFKWSNDGEIRFADLKDGEIIDANMSPSYSGHAREVEFNANLTASNNEVVVENEVSAPISKKISKTNKQVFEFENNFAGYVSFDINAKKGQTIKIVMGEMLDENEDVTLRNVQCVRKGKRTPLQEVIYTCKEGENHYHGKFYYGGFKYVSVESDISFELENIKQFALYTRLTIASKFECSENLINILVDNTLRSLKSNSVDIPTDCPTRERMGWTGDSQLFFNSAAYLTDYSAFARKHVVDVYDRQDKNGRLPQIAPYSAEDWFMDVMNGSVGWADVGILIPYRFYKRYGDIRILEENFDNMERYARFMINRCGRTKGIYAIYAKPLHMSKENKKYQVNNGQSYGEWAEPNDVKAFVWTDFCEPHPEESMAYTAWMMKLMVEICDLVGKTQNKALYEEYEKGVTRAYQELVTKPRFSLDTNRQAKLVRPLYMNLLDDKQTEYAKKRLITALDNYDWKLGTGFLSTPFILDVLSDIDPEYAYKLLLNKQMPGWLYMAIHNTGTIWEGWEGPTAQLGISSLNHYSKGALVEWLFSGMCGIKVAGENKFEIKPVIGSGVDYAKASYDSIYGTIASSWKKEDGKITISVTIPSNTTCNYKYGNDTKVLEPGSYTFTY